MPFTLTRTAALVWRDYVTDGVPSSGKHRVVKGDARTWGGEIEDYLDGTTALDQVDIDGGAIDGTPIGAATPSTGAFTALTSTGGVDFSAVTNKADLRIALGLEIGANVQAYSAALDLLVANSLTAAELQQLQNIGAVTISGTQWGYLGAATPSGGALLGAADVAAQRSALGLGALALLNTVNTAQIADKAVTLAKLADMATNSLLGRNTAGTGVPEILTPAQVRTILNVEDGATAGGGWELVATQTLGSGSGIVEQTGLSGYRKIRVFLDGEPNANGADLILEASPDGVTWRSLVTFAGITSANDSIFFDAEISNFNDADADDRMFGRASCGVGTTGLVVSANENEAAVATRCFSSYRSSETWDRIRIRTPSNTLQTLTTMTVEGMI